MTSFSKPSRRAVTAAGWAVPVAVVAQAAPAFAASNVPTGVYITGTQSNPGNTWSGPDLGTFTVVVSPPPSPGCPYTVNVTSVRATALGITNPLPYNAMTYTPTSVVTTTGNATFNWSRNGYSAWVEYTATGYVVNCAGKRFDFTSTFYM